MDSRISPVQAAVVNIGVLKCQIHSSDAVTFNGQLPQPLGLTTTQFQSGACLEMTDIKWDT